MKTMLLDLLSRFDSQELRGSVIPWGSPIPSFGDLTTARVATLGLNPSNREFVDIRGKELSGTSRRFHTLRSLGLRRWKDASSHDADLIVDSCRAYFAKNPYDGWFRRLDHVLSNAGVSYYASGGACHLDLVPYATARKWTSLRSRERSALLRASGDVLGVLLRDSDVRVLVLNGSAVVKNFERVAGCRLKRTRRQDWMLPHGVGGWAYHGRVKGLAKVALAREVLVIGFNHNIQSSFGVTRDVVSSIGRWIGRVTKRALR